MDEHEAILRQDLYYCLSAQDMSKADILFKELKPNDIQLYNRMIKTLLESKLYSMCWEYFDLIRTEGLEPNVFTYSIMVNVCCMENDLEKAKMLWDEVEQNEKLRPDRVLANSFLQTLLSVGKIDEAIQWVQDMKTKEIVPDAVTYNTLISGFIRREQNVEKALTALNQILSQMEKENLEMNAYTYKILMKFSLRLTDPSEAMRYVDRLLKRNIPMDPEVYTSLIEEYSRTKRGKNYRTVIRQCWGFYLELEKKQVPIPIEFFESILHLFVRYGQWPAVFGVLDIINEKHLPMTRNVYSILFQGLANSRSLGSELAVVAKILADEFEDTPIKTNYNIMCSLISVFLQARDLESAEVYLDKMRKLRIRPAMRVYNSFLDYFSDNRYVRDWQTSFEKGMEIWKNMKEEGCIPDLRVYAALLKIFAKSCQWDALDETLAEMKKQKLYPFVVNYNIMLQMCVKGKDPVLIQRAWRYFNQMKEGRVTPTVVTYTTMINACVVQGDFEGGIRLFEEMKKKNVLPNEHTYTSLMHLAKDAGNTELVQEYFDEISKNGLLANTTAYGLLIHAYGKARNLDKVLRILEEMEAKNMSRDLTVFCNLIDAVALCGRTDLIYHYFDEYKHRRRDLDHDAYILIAKALEKSGDMEGAAAMLEMEREREEQEQKHQNL